MELINEDYLSQLINGIVKKALSKDKEDLTGKTWSVDEFSKKCCGNKSANWVRTFIFDEYPETSAENGGWCVNPRGKGTKTIIFAKEASEWMQEHQHEIDWNERI